ncbi:MAG: RCC1 domain-containing protein, partial [Myxococcaceae bacterium]
CGASCTACAAPANGVATCDGTSCGFTCNTGYHACSGACVSNSSVSSCGASCTPCPVPANGTATCDGTSCGITCPSGFAACGSRCCLATSLAGGTGQSCAVTGLGAVKCWGRNDFGQLGDGTTTARLSPVTAVGLSSGAVAVAAGDAYSCALTSAGGLKCWGYNLFGTLGIGTTVDRLTPVDVFTSGIASVAAGGVHTCAATGTGSLMCWGYNGQGGLGDGTLTNRSAPVGVTGLSSGVAAVATGTTHTCAVLSGGGLRCWGFNANGQLGNGTTTRSLTPVGVVGLSSGVVAVAAGLYHTCALTSSGGVKCWGDGTSGQLGNGATGGSLVPVDVVGLTTGVASIAAGEQHTCALSTSGGVKCWGYGPNGQIGDGTGANRLTPVDVVGLTSGVVAIGLGQLHSCALTVGGGAKCWGRNYYGELGDGTSGGQSLTPVDVVSFP